MLLVVTRFPRYLMVAKLVHKVSKICLSSNSVREPVSTREKFLRRRMDRSVSFVLQARGRADRAIPCE